MSTYNVSYLKPTDESEGQLPDGFMCSTWELLDDADNYYLSYVEEYDRDDAEALREFFQNSSFSPDVNFRDYEYFLVQARNIYPNGSDDELWQHVHEEWYVFLEEQLHAEFQRMKSGVA